jgi:hypothetical protein
MTGPLRTIADGRRASFVFYFYEEDLGGLSRRFRTEPATGKIEMYKYHWRPEFPLANRDTLSRVAAGYRKAIEEVGRAGGVSNSVPLTFLGGVQFITGAYIGGVEDAMRSESGYKARPSAIRPLLYLELALLEKKLERPDYHSLLEQAVTNLNLLKMDFRSDVEFRRGKEDENYDRPECALLYLAGRSAESRSRTNEAVCYYTTLIEQAPGSPNAWEACARLRNWAKSGEEVKRVNRLEQILVDTYPLIWGWRRWELKPELEKSAVSEVIHNLLTQAADEAAK